MMFLFVVFLVVFHAVAASWMRPTGNADSLTGAFDGRD